MLWAKTSCTSVKSCFNLSIFALDLTSWNSVFNFFMNLSVIILTCLSLKSLCSYQTSRNNKVLQLFQSLICNRLMFHNDFSLPWKIKIIARFALFFSIYLLEPGMQFFQVRICQLYRIVSLRKCHVNYSVMHFVTIILLEIWLFFSDITIDPNCQH